MRNDDKLKSTTGTVEHDVNRDPLTGEPGSHPVGTGVGAATGAATGAAIGGAVGGPPGALLGAAIGGVAGGFAGKGMAEAVNPTEEDALWRANYHTRPYAAGRTYDDLSPAYRYGWESRGRYADRTFDQAANDLERGWDNLKDKTKLRWHEAKDATRDAWDRVENSATRTAGPFNDNTWRSGFSARPYAAGANYDDYSPAYRYGWESRNRYQGRPFEEVQNDLERGWDKAKGQSKLGWEKAKLAVRDAWHGVERALPGDADHDGR